MRAREYAKLQGNRKPRTPWSGQGTERWIPELPICVGPNRTLRQLTLTTPKAREFETLMGSDVSRRKDFLIAHSELVDRDALDY